MTNEILYTMNWVKTVLLDLLKLYILSFILLALFYRLLLLFFLYSTCCLCPLCLAILTFSLPWSLLFMCVSVWPAMWALFFLRVETEESVPIPRLHCIIVEALGSSSGLRVEAHVVRALASALRSCFQALVLRIKAIVEKRDYKSARVVWRGYRRCAALLEAFWPKHYAKFM